MASKSSSRDPRILAIIVNWNKREYLRNLLLSLRKLGGTGFDILVVDNASNDGSPDMIREEFPECQLHETGENLGGTGGFNAGMVWGLESETDYDFFWLMDNDIVVHEGALDALLDAMQSDRGIAIAGSTILVLGQNQLVQEIGAHVEWRGCGLRRNGEGKRDAIPTTPILEADYAAACSLLARVQAVREVGIWDPCYFVFWDDVDWGVRFRRAGWRVVGVTGSVVEHEHFDNRRSQQSHVAAYLVHRNALYFFWRFSPPKSRLRNLYHLLKVLRRNARSFEITGRTGSSRAILEAILHASEGRMGPPPEFVKTIRSDKVHSEAQADDDSGLSSAARIAFVITETSETTLQQLESLRKRTPRAIVHAILPDASALTESEERLGRRRHVPVRTVLDRLRAAFDLRRYDVVIVPEAFPLAAYLQTSKSLRLLSSEGGMRSIASGFTAVFRKGPPLIADRLFSFKIAWKMQRSIPAPVNYFPFKGASS